MRREQALKIREILLESGQKFSDAEIASRIVLLDAWVTDASYKKDERVRYAGKAYKCRQEHISQSDWTPDVAQSLWEVLDVEHSGTQDDPMLYSIGMSIFKDKYYLDDGVLYLCIRDSGQALYHPLSALIDNYVERVE